MQADALAVEDLLRFQGIGVLLWHHTSPYRAWRNALRDLSSQTTRRCRLPEHNASRPGTAERTLHAVLRSYGILRTSYQQDNSFLIHWCRAIFNARTVQKWRLKLLPDFR